LVEAAAKNVKEVFDSKLDSHNYPELLIGAHAAITNEARKFMRLFACSDKA